MTLRVRALIAVMILLVGAVLFTFSAFHWNMSMQSQLIMILVSVLVVCLAVSIWFSYNFLAPLKKLLQVVKDVEDGSYQAAALANIAVRRDELGKLARAFDHMAREASARDRRLRLLRKVIPTGVGLSAEKDFNRLLESIVIESQSIANADGGTLYMIEDGHLKFMIVRNTAMDLAMGGTTGNPITFPPLPLADKNGEPNHCNISTHTALINNTVNIPDAYQVEGFDFSGTRAFDQRTGYHSQSFLSIPLQNDEQHAIGVLQLINARDPETGAVIPFVADEVFETLVLLASISLTAYIRQSLLRKEIEKLNIEIDHTKKVRLVNEITETEYFRDLLKKVAALRSKRNSTPGS